MFRNIYQDDDYASSYASLDWSGTYYLVYRDLRGILDRHVSGRRALDFGCGTGRSTRLLRSFGFKVTGVDVAESMIRGARVKDPSGLYLLLRDGSLTQFPTESFDLVLAAFPFDNIPNQQKTDLFREIWRILRKQGLIVNIVSSPEIYTHEWASFSTSDYPENLLAHDGDIVRIVTQQFGTSKPAEDILCSDQTYRQIYRSTGLRVLAQYAPLGRNDDPILWVSEREIAPWMIYVLGSEL